MKRRGKQRAKGKHANAANEEEANEKSKQILQTHIRKLVIRKRMLEPVPEKATTSRVDQRPKLPPTYYSRLKESFNKAFYEGNQMKIPNIQSIYISDHFRSKGKRMRRTRLNSETDIEETLVILRAFEVQAILVHDKIVKEVAEKCRTYGYVVSPFVRARIEKLAALRDGMKRDCQALRDQLAMGNKRYKQYRHIYDKTVVPSMMIGSNGEQISDEGYKSLSDKLKKRNPMIYVPGKSYEQIKMEFKALFYEKKVPKLEGVYAKQNTGAKPTSSSTERRNAQEHCEILARLITVMEAKVLNTITKEITRELDNFDLEEIYSDDSIPEVEKALLHKDPNTLVIVDTEGEDIPDEAHRKLFKTELRQRLNQSDKF